MPANTDTETVSYSSDSPINSRDEDRFDRAPFATRIAETIAARKDTSSLIVAIYGAWGDGKTSVLNMIQEGLRAHPNVVIGWFNPWFFNNEVDLIRSFFAILAAAVGKSPETNLQKIGDKLRRYGHLSLSSLYTIRDRCRPGPGKCW